MNRLLANGVLFGGAVALSLLLAEGVVRLHFDPVDYLIPELVPHPVLSHAIEPGSGGHDAWGFRNASIPQRVPVVAIGDSQTYGLSATARRSWPAQLGRLLGQPVYNLALGGYGPRDYQHLLVEYASRLDPEDVVIGFYFGNDLVPAAKLAYAAAGQAAPRPDRRDPRFLGGLRSLLSRHSVLYQASKLGLPLLANALRRAEARTDGRDTVEIAHAVAGTRLAPEHRFGVLDLSRDSIRHGLDDTIRIFREMAGTCRERGIRCHLLLIPTKESVYAELARALPDPERRRVEALVETEELVRERLVGSLSETGLKLIDPLPALRAAVSERRLYPVHEDGHPTAEGYAVIAGVVNEFVGRP